ncbi:hypothetical protein EYC84_003463 [Monilinia fructicola]|uniref:Uncharacterized protein n=1 Tax=Monilinia fructicola TaxID=38448 RepID=A0A5M9JXN1_MONFR|nr:hypothetical protein EYC84_003463 [Monilinia fructicola]
MSISIIHTAIIFLSADLVNQSISQSINQASNQQSANLFLPHSSYRIINKEKEEIHYPIFLTSVIDVDTCSCICRDRQLQRIHLPPATSTTSLPPYQPIYLSTSKNNTNATNPSTPHPPVYKPPYSVPKYKLKSLPFPSITLIYLFSPSNPV